MTDRLNCLLFFSFLFPVTAGVLLSAPMISAHDFSHPSSVSFSDAIPAECQSDGNQLQQLASYPHLFGFQKTQLIRGFSRWTEPGALSDSSGCLASLVQALGGLTQNSSGSGPSEHLGALDRSSGRGSIFVLSDGTGNVIRMGLVNIGTHQAGFDIVQNGNIFCQWPDSRCILDSDANHSQFLSHSLPLVFDTVQVRGPLVFFSTRWGSNAALAKNCHLFPASNPKGNVHVAIAPSGYSDPASFFTDMSRELELLQESLGPLFSSLEISYVTDNVPCQAVGLQGTVGQHFDRCDVGLAQQSCATNYVHVLINQGDSVRGSTSGTMSNCNSGGVGCTRHELGHLLFGLPDRYCCDGSYHRPTVYRSGEQCRAELSVQSKDNATYRDYLLDVVSNALALRKNEDPSLLVSELNRTLSTPVACVGLNDSNGHAYSVLNQLSFMKDLSFPSLSQDELAYIQHLLNISVSPSPESRAQMFLQLDFESNRLSVNDFRILYGVYDPYSAPLTHVLNYSYFSPSGRYLGSYLFADPRFVGGDVQNQTGLHALDGFDPNASFSVNLPYLASASRLSIFDENGSLTSVALNVSDSAYCKAAAYLSDGFCDPLCPLDIDCLNKSGSSGTAVSPSAVPEASGASSSAVPEVRLNSLPLEWYAVFALAVALLFAFMLLGRNPPERPMGSYGPPRMPS